MIRRCGRSRSFPEPHPFLDLVDSRLDVVLVIGDDDAAKEAALLNKPDHVLVLVELGTECLGTYTGEAFGEEGSNVLGLARYRLGTEAPGRLVELVMQPRTRPTAIELARVLLQKAGLESSVCRDMPGRILDRMIRPYLNAVLERIDDGLATRADLDLAIELGLGHPCGPVRLLEQAGLEQHCEITEALHRAGCGTGGFAPARRALVARAWKQHVSPTGNRES